MSRSRVSGNRTSSGCPNNTYERRSRTRRTWITAAIIAIIAGGGVRVGRGQGTGATTGGALDEPISGPVDPAAQTAAPREVKVGSGVAMPEVPLRAPDRFAVMGFENRAGVRALDWAMAGVPFAIGEKIERVFGLMPAFGPLVVPEGPVVPATADAVAALAKARQARWIVAGWVARPNWQLQLHVQVWGWDGKAATLAAEHDVIGPMQDAHALVGATLVAVAARAGWTLPADGATKLAAAPSKDLYAFTLLGRGLGRWLGAIGPADPKAAAKDLTRSIFIDPFMVEGQRLVGELWARDPDPKVAAKAAGKFSYAVDLAPGYAPALRAAAERARQSGKADVALELFARVVRARPWDLDARVGLGDARWQAGDVDGALRELGRVVERRPDDLGARRLLALIHGARGDTAKLADELEAVTRLAPDDLDAVVDLGAAYAELGRVELATTAFERVATARPADATAQKRVADLYRRRGDATSAVRWYNKVAALAPADPRPLFLIGATQLDAGNIEEARRAFIRAQKFERWLGQTYVLLGTTAWLGGKHDEALWYWRNAVRRRPRSPIARYDFALAASSKNLTDVAIGQLDILEQLTPGDAGVAYLRGVVLARAGQRDAAREAFALALRRDPGHDDARWNLGVLGRDGDDLRHEGKPRLELPFGDREAFRAAIERFASTEARMTTLRVQFQANVNAALQLVGEGPGKPPRDPKAPRATAKTCPLLAVAPKWSLAQKAYDEFVRAGVDLEDAYRVVATYDDYGETAALGPAWRQRVADVRSGYKLALADVREMKTALKTQLGRELAVRNCSEALLAAAAATPELYRPTGDTGNARRPAGQFVPRPPIDPAVATFYVDNRECPEPIGVYVDGAWLGEVPAHQRTALQARVGRRTLCLLPEPASATCGDQGTAREVYLHDGWSALMRCPTIKR